ncbi:hypothetical protein TGPRC2_223750 [Toxoplasma gondii TgCatPRC2]|uniref:Uncharacterized protein n=3 Tax=Toxoplasma gondii TaxID=5811 RepID=A0A151HQU5_TOXGO|nr:hypothetical protein TGME49_223750 [Toxoplasma gondii ME49]EPT26886.1 hypothetical protein TGME49_223750 [Toxoplasma gondii ME49]KFG45805.1 hypothetical protein TGDOM2_223750 [Toxoplasma gondii GAB2-2007-GAL-DOM2]KYK71708.1 hypothetical protein TGPRC2_223750 [Toxoplasma gondii TgCatPRC2]|eukprot:XP_018635909.1 hypothetical protein TGME49_223750 [Toxoplasma gondii ME49]
MRFYPFCGSVHAAKMPIGHGSAAYAQQDTMADIVQGIIFERNRAVLEARAMRQEEEVTLDLVRAQRDRIEYLQKELRQLSQNFRQVCASQALNQEARSKAVHQAQEESRLLLQTSQENTELQARAHALAAQCEAAQQAEKHLSEKVSALERVQKTLQAQLVAAEAKGKDYAAQLAETKKAVESIQFQARAAEAAVKCEEATRKQYEDRIAELEHQVAEYTTRLSAAQEETKKLVLENTKAKTQVAIAAAKAEVKAKASSAAVEKVAGEDEALTMEKFRAKMKEEGAAARRQFEAKLQEAEERYRKDISDVRELLEKERTQWILQSEEEKRQLLAQAESEKEHVKRRVQEEFAAQIRAAETQAKERKMDAREATAKLQAENEALQKAKVALEEAAKREKEEREQERQERQKVQERMSQMEEEVVRLRNERDEKAVQDQQPGEKKLVSVEVEALSKEAENLRQKVAILEKEQKKLETEKLGLERENARLQEELGEDVASTFASEGDVMSAGKAKSKEVHDLEDELEKTREEVQKWKRRAVHERQRRKSEQAIGETDDESGDEAKAEPEGGATFDEEEGKEEQARTEIAELTTDEADSGELHSLGEEELVKRLETMREKLKTARSVYMELVQKYNTLVKKYNKLIDVVAAMDPRKREKHKEAVKTKQDMPLEDESGGGIFSFFW